MVQSKTTARVVSREVIKLMGLAGAISTVAVAPNSAVMFNTILKHIDKRNAKRTVAYLKYRKLVEVKQIKGENYYRLTNSGLAKFRRIEIDDMKIKTPRRWDHKWRLVMFDIPTRKAKHRTLLLFHLRQLGFYKLQDSVWVHPFDCQAEVGVLVDYTMLKQYVSYLVVLEGNFTGHAEKYFIGRGLLL